MNDFRHSHGQNRSRGVIGLMTVILLGAMILSMGISMAFIGQTQIIASGDIDQERTLQAIAETCVDEALLRLKLDAAYVGGTVALGSGSCTVVVTGTGDSRALAVSASTPGYAKNLAVTATQKRNTAGNSRGWDIQGWREITP